MNLQIHKEEEEAGNGDGLTHIYYHFTAFAGSDLAKQLQDEGFCHVPGQIPHIPSHINTNNRKNNKTDPEVISGAMRHCW